MAKEKKKKIKNKEVSPVIKIGEIFRNYWTIRDSSIASIVLKTSSKMFK